MRGAPARAASVSLAILADMGNAIAINKGQIKAKLPERFNTMGTVRCEGCGEEFLIAEIGKPEVDWSKTEQRSGPVPRLFQREPPVAPES